MKKQAHERALLDWSREWERELIVQRLKNAQTELLETYGIDNNFQGFADSLRTEYKPNRRLSLIEKIVILPLVRSHAKWTKLLRNQSMPSRPPFNAEYLLYLLLRKDEREFVIGDLIEGYDQVLRRFNKRRADIWFYKQVCGSLLPLLRRALLRIGALIWLGRILRRLVS